MSDPLALAAELERLNADATIAPWTLLRRGWREIDGQKYETDGPCLVMSLADCEHHPVADTSANHTCRTNMASEANAALIVALRNGLPMILEALRRGEATK